MAADLIQGLDDVHENFLRSVDYVPKAMSFFRLSHEVPGLPKEDIYFPRSEDDKLVYISYQPYHTDPDGEKLLRITARTPHVRALLEKDDDACLDWMEREAARYAPEAVEAISDRYIARWRYGIPTCPPGYLKSLERFLHAPPVPGLAFFRRLSCDFVDGRSVPYRS